MSNSYVESKVDIILNEEYSPANNVKGFAEVTGSNIYFYKNGKIATNIKLPHHLTKSAKDRFLTKYYEDQSGSQYLFIYDRVEETLYSAENIKGKKRPVIKKLIDSISINNYIVRNYYNNLVLIYTTNDFNKVNLFLLK